MIDLKNITPPTIVEELSFESIFSAMLSDLQARDSAFTALVESDPAYKILEVCAYRELLIRQRVNDGAKAVMLAYAVGSDLENLGALVNVSRKLIIPEDLTTNPVTNAVYEDDESLRYRIQTAFTGLSTAGPKSSYLFHALSVDTIKDANIVGPPTVPNGNVKVIIVSTLGDGTATQAQIDAVYAKLNDDNIRPLTDFLTVESATILPYKLNLTLHIRKDWDSAVVISQATAKVREYCESVRKVGYEVWDSSIIASATVPGVDRVVLNVVDGSINTSLYVTYNKCSYLTGLIINTQVISYT